MAKYFFTLAFMACLALGAAAQDENEAKAKLDEAITQIQDKDYGNILPLKKEILRIAAVFNADPKVRAFSEFTAL